MNQPTEIHWKDWESDEPVWAWNAKMGSDINCLGEVIADDVCHPEDLPNYFNASAKEYGRFISAFVVAEYMHENWRLTVDKSKDKKIWRFPSNVNAESLYEWFTESLYSFCDPEPDESLLSDARGLSDLQEALDRFKSLNLFIWRILGAFRWFNPRKHSIGMKDLQAALDQATQANQHHCVYQIDSKVKIMLDWEFWMDFYDI